MLRIREVAKATGIEPWRWYEILKRGEGPAHVTIGRTIRISDAALAEWIAACEAESKRQSER